MFYIRVLGLLFVPLAAHLMGVTLLIRSLASVWDSTGGVMLLVALIWAVCFYMLPTYEAWNNKHPRVFAISILNVFLGWTFAGWVVAAVWAHVVPQQPAHSD